MRTNFPTVPPSVPKVDHEVGHAFRCKNRKNALFFKVLEKVGQWAYNILYPVAQFGEQSVAGAFGRSGWARQVRGLVRRRDHHLECDCSRQSFTMRLDCNEYTRT